MLSAEWPFVYLVLAGSDGHESIVNPENIDGNALVTAAECMLDTSSGIYPTTLPVSLYSVCLAEPFTLPLDAELLLLPGAPELFKPLVDLANPLLLLLAPDVTTPPPF